MQQSVTNPALDREVNGYVKMALYCTILVLFDVTKQLASYGMKYYNHGFYPIPQTQVVASAELLKFFVFLSVTAVSQGGLKQIRLSAWYAVPSIIYIVNNNIFYLALYYTTPPIWNILIQMRIILTALTYRLFFRRTVTTVQWIALTVLIVAIVISDWSASQAAIGSQHPGHFLKALLLALFGSVTSVIGTIVMEFLFKNDGRAFCDMQTQLYLFGSIAGWSAYTAESCANGNWHANMIGSPSIVCTLLVSDLVLSCFSGFIVAVIVKKFDNIVKLYTQAVSNMFMALACSFLFPEFFRFGPVFIGCMVAVFTAIILYESKDFSTAYHLTVQRCIDKCDNSVRFVIVFLLAVVIVAVAAVNFHYKFEVS